VVRPLQPTNVRTGRDPTIVEVTADSSPTPVRPDGVGAKKRHTDEWSTIRSQSQK
jgi:hypothetical protein